MGRVEFRGVDCELEVGELERDEERSATRNRDNTVASSRGERERGGEVELRRSLWFESYNRVDQASDCVVPPTAAIERSLGFSLLSA